MLGGDFPFHHIATDQRSLSHYYEGQYEAGVPTPQTQAHILQPEALLVILRIIENEIDDAVQRVELGMDNWGWVAA